MRRKYKIWLVIIGVLLVLTIGLGVLKLFMPNEKEKREENVTNVISNIDEYGYSLDDRDTDYMKEVFKDLEKTLKEKDVNYEDYAKNLAKLFVIDFYTLNNKINKYDVGSLEYIYSESVNDFKNKAMATKLNLSEEDIYLTELIALLHDIGRFEEITFLKRFDNVKFDNALYGVKMLFEDNLIRNFIEDDCYDEIIKTAILNHSRLSNKEGLNERCLLHSKIIRDADKLDNFRVKKEEQIEAIFPEKVKDKSDMENSKLSDEVYKTIQNQKCVDIHDRITVLDYWCCVLAFVFDLNFRESYEIVKSNNYINTLIDRFSYNDLETKKRMEDVRNIMNSFISDKIKRSNKNG